MKTWMFVVVAALLTAVVALLLVLVVSSKDSPEAPRTRSAEQQCWDTGGWWVDSVGCLRG